MSQSTLILWLLLAASAAQEDGDSFLASTHWIHVQKCCPESQMMVEVAHTPSASSTGSKFECQQQNSSFRWAPDLVDDKDNVLPFEESLENDFESDGDVNITKFCINNGPCISPIVGKPQCGPVSFI